jgi:DNA polymerase-4
MSDEPIVFPRGYPRAIVHLDADAFFASVEEALNPRLRGKPVVTGQERGIVACPNYEAKRRGIRRGVPLFQARKLCPEVVILPNDYESYSIYSKRMFEIMRAFTPQVEEYSIDEAFADITGLRRLYRTSYKGIAEQMQARVKAELGITVSVGVSCSKALAKICSKFRKPEGITAVPGHYIEILLKRTPLEAVWGIGGSSEAMLRRYGVATAYDFVRMPERTVRRLLHKPGWELWMQLRGHAVCKVDPEPKLSYATIMKSKTFTPPSGNRELVLAMLLHNTELAFAKARRYRMRPAVLAVVLRHADFRHDGLEAALSRPTASTLEAIPVVRALFDRLFRVGASYRSTMIVLGRLESDRSEQYDFFFDTLRIDTYRRLTHVVDQLNHRFGKGSVASATSLFIQQKPKVVRDLSPERWMRAPTGTGRRHLAIPRWDITV